MTPSPIGRPPGLTPAGFPDVNHRGSPSSNPGGANSAVLPFEGRASNLALSGSSSGAPSAPHLAGLPAPVGVETVLTPEQLQQYMNDAQAFIASLEDVSAQDTPPLGALPTASCLDQAKGIMAGGAAAYGTSFLFGKLASNAASLWSPLLGAWGFPLIAGPLHAILGESIGGGARANYGTYSSPDGAAWANYRTALGRLEVARMSGNSASIARCKADLDAVVKGVTDRMAAEAQKAEDGSGSALWSPVSDPMASAALRAFITDELPFLVFSLCYMLSGAALPYERAALGGPDLSDKAKLATADFVTSAVLGMAAGMGTVLTQNVLRPWLQHSPAPKAGIHSPEVANLHIAQLSAKIAKVQEHRNVLTAMLKAEPHDELRGDIQRALDTNLRKLGKYGRKLGKMRTTVGRNEITADRLLAASVRGKPKNTPAFLDGGPSQRRLGAKALGNIAAVMPHVLYMIHLSNLASQELALDKLHPADGSAPDPQYIDDGISALLWPAMLAGWSLIACWLTRSLWTPVIEDLLNRLEGCRRLVVQGGREPEVVIHAAPLTPQEQRQGGREGMDYKHGDEDDVRLSVHLERQQAPFEGDVVKTATDLLLWPFLEASQGSAKQALVHYRQAMDLAGEHLVSSGNSPADKDAQRGLLMDVLANTLKTSLFDEAGVAAIFSKLPPGELIKIIERKPGVQSPQAQDVTRLARKALLDTPVPARVGNSSALNQLRVRNAAAGDASAIELDEIPPPPDEPPPP